MRAVEAMWRLYGGCVEAIIWRMYAGCVEAVRRLYKGCVQAVWRLCEGCKQGGWGVTHADVPVAGLHAGNGHQHGLDLQDGGGEVGGGQPLGRELVASDADGQQLEALTGRRASVGRSHPQLKQRGTNTPTFNVSIRL